MATGWLSIEGWRVLTAPDVDASRLVRGVLERLAAWRPSNGRDAVEATLAADGGRMIRWRAHRIAFLAGDRSPAGGVHVKLYGVKDAVERAIEVVTPSRAPVSFRIGRAMIAAGLPTPEPLLMMMQKRWRLHRESVLLAKALPEPNVVLSKELQARVAAGKPIRALVEDAARLAARMHEAGFFHGDFTAGNLVLAGGGLWIIDLDRAKDVRRLPAAAARRLQLLDLRMLLLTTWAEIPRRLWMRLLARYGRERRWPRDRRRRFAAAVLRARRGRLRLGAKVPPLAGREPWR